LIETNALPSKTATTNLAPILHHFEILDLPTPEGWKAELAWVAWLNAKTAIPVNGHPSTMSPLSQTAVINT